jgi:hypothetical protein
VVEGPALPARRQHPPAASPQAQGSLATASNRLVSYGSAEPQLTSINQLGDLRPSDWAYQALASLVERYGCGAGYANGSFDGSRAISRFEAAALLNGCLERITQTTDQLGKLLQEFGPELALLRGRVDGLAGRVGALEASQFAPTTTLSGLAVFVLGGNRFLHSGPVTKPSRNLPNGTSFNYDLELALNTSFSGKDLLRTVLRAGDFGATPLAANPPGWAWPNWKWRLKATPAPTSWRSTNFSTSGPWPRASRPPWVPGSARTTCSPFGPVPIRPTRSST